MDDLTWEQVHGWRLTQHSLLERAGREHMLDVVARIGGLHAQLMSAAELSLWARADLAPDDVDKALWETRTLVKTWAMRGTLHLLTAAEYPTYVAALSTLRHFRRGSWLKYHGVSLAELEAILEGARTILTDAGMTREQLAEALAAHAGNPKLAELLRSGWGALLKPASFQGHLCFGPSQDQNVTFVSPERWLGRREPVDPPAALKEIARRYLTAYGPATIDELARWIGLEESAARKVFRALGAEVEAVEVEGWQGWMLAEALKPMRTLKAVRSVRLLPNFDPYVVALARQSDFLMPAAYRDRVYRAQGWISPVVLVNGRIAGVWEYDKQRSRIAVKVELFAPPSDEVQDGIEAEANRLGAFLGGPVELSYGQG
jgi:hypothetical protein